jgi:hypothetical protein
VAKGLILGLLSLLMILSFLACVAGAPPGPAWRNSTGWALKVHPVLLLAFAMGGATFVRLFLSFWKALAVSTGEFDVCRDADEPDRDAGSRLREEDEDCLDRFWLVFWGWSERLSIGARDYWLNFFIGVAELCAYPVLIASGQVEVIGGWVAIKTAGQWQAWQKCRTSFNRFLLGNILILAISYLWLQHFVIV